MGVKLVSSSGGSVEIVAPVTASTYTQTLPANNGTILTTATAGIPISGPAFSAYQSSAQTLTSATLTKLQYQTEEFDTNSCFDNATNYRFTPTVAGYYQVNAYFEIGSSPTGMFLAVYKNGAQFKRGTNINSSYAFGTSINALVYLNGSSDYIEMYGYVGAGQALAASLSQNFFQAAMVRSAT
jgi:hypothetical protein